MFSFDGAGADRRDWFPVFLKAGQDAGATFTFFLSGVYLLPQERRLEYKPPKRPAGTSDIGFQQAARMPEQIAYLTEAHRAGHEIGTHFNGHFCGPTGVKTWTAADWRSELDQFFAIAGPHLPFDLRKAVRGGRTPCLEGDRPAMFKAFRVYGFRYDASEVGTLSWPRKKAGLWRFPLPSLVHSGTGKQVLSMDYNFYALHSGARDGQRGMWRRWQRQTADTYVKTVRRQLAGNRAPVFIGNHFENWNGGIYMRALLTAMDEICRDAEVRCVSYAQLADWLEAQDGRTLARLQSLT
ncbi:hypothetical protein HerbRD11066_38640 [Herbidospora sp. RD11066]